MILAGLVVYTGSYAASSRCSGADTTPGKKIVGIRVIKEDDLTHRPGSRCAT